MLFNSVSFAVFLPIVFMLYWYVCGKSLSLQNKLLLLASYFFYSCWDWRFLFLLLFSTVLDFYAGRKIEATSILKTRRVWLWISIVINLGLLGVFKYFNFFSLSFKSALSHLGLHVSAFTIDVILPVGISFYTFHGLSYIIDIYKNKIKAEKNFVDYAVFVSFFPLLVAGPIERATHLLPQIKQVRSFDLSRACDAMRQILWGFFKKIVIADNCAPLVDQIFDNYHSLSSPVLAIGAVLFAFQIYCDFSGYSDIALGTARLFGIELLKNFNFPYFARNIADFWRRWHISLSSWFRDYLYIPMGGAGTDLFQKIRNIGVVFIVSGFWHGANLTFLAWGLLHAIYYIPGLVFNANKSNTSANAPNNLFSTTKIFIEILVTFCLTTLAWVFFRANNIRHAFSYLSRMFSFSKQNLIETPHLSNLNTVLCLILIFVIVEWLGRNQNYAIENLKNINNVSLRWFLYIGVVVFIYIMGNFQQHTFIYFQF